MRIIEMLPELDMGGVERHVVDLANGLADKGHEVLVISAGGKMQSQLSIKVLHRILPVHRKNLLTGYACVRQVSKWVMEERWEIIHAHSRVPSFIAWWVSSKTNTPWVCTAHACYSLNAGLMAFRHAGEVICVSKAVQEYLKEYLPNKNTVIVNALPEPKVKWNHPTSDKTVFLFAGRLTAIKGLQIVIKALSNLLDYNWVLNVVGDGPMRSELKELSQICGVMDRINFLGYSDRIDEYMISSSCLLFPSLAEGYGLTLARAVQIGVPFIASALPAVTEMLGTSNGLVEAGNIGEWEKTIRDFMNGHRGGGKRYNMPQTFSKMINENENIYRELIRDGK
jgi:glycosyltransferase involved in cell wall biosynthesis